MEQGMLQIRNLLSKSLFKSKQLKLLLCVAVLFSLAKSAHGQTIVDVKTSLGDFSIELFDSAAPATVANFLNYVTSGRYDQTFIHRSVPGFIVQGGGFSLNESQQQLVPVAVDAPVTNEFNQSNTRGTLAMAKLGGDPNSATSQWFVNLADNGANLDNQNGGFTVFGRVLGDGMAIVDSIARLPRSPLNATVSEPPLINFTGLPLLTANLVTVNMSVAAAANFQNAYVPQTGILKLRVALSDGALIELQFNQVASSPNFVFQVAQNSVTTLTQSDSTFAQFDLGTGVLTIPELTINGEVAGRNVRFDLTDAQQLLFTLISFE
jgi:peptidyl-prolyl cis-trans isomerase A (cyclophilin A)